MLAAAVPVFALFGWRQHRIAVTGGWPLISPALFRHRSFTAGPGISLLVTATVACFGLTFSMLLQTGHRYSPVHAVLTALFLTLGMTMVWARGRHRAHPGRRPRPPRRGKSDPNRSDHGCERTFCPPRARRTHDRGRRALIAGPLAGHKPGDERALRLFADTLPRRSGHVTARTAQIPSLRILNLLHCDRGRCPCSAWTYVMELLISWSITRRLSAVRNTAARRIGQSVWPEQPHVRRARRLQTGSCEVMAFGFRCALVGQQGTSRRNAPY